MSENYTTFERQSTYPFNAQTLFDYHKKPGCINRLLPPWDNTQVIERSGGLAKGAKTRLKIKFGPFSVNFIAEHLRAIEGEIFEDIQRKGPFKHWNHLHYFKNKEHGGQLYDLVKYKLPLEELLPKFIKQYAQKHLEKTFSYRHYIIENDLTRHQQYSNKSLKILISGASGVLGQELVPFLTTGGHNVWTLVRREPAPNSNEIYWNPATGEIDSEAIPKVDAVIHLAGEYIGLGRWSKEKKQKVIESRKRGTTLLAETIAQMKTKPSVFLSSSAIGYYGNCDSQIVDENRQSGSGFMAKVCRTWEESTYAATNANIRTVMLRMGVALSARGGALQKLLQIAPIGFPKSFGDGTQYTSWISSDDMLAAILHCICTKTISGPINIAAPNPVTNEELLYTLAKLKNKPIFPRVPKSYLTTFYGEMANEIALSSCRVSVQKLLDSGFTFRHKTLTEAIKPQLGIFD